MYIASDIFLVQPIDAVCMVDVCFYSFVYTETSTGTELIAGIFKREGFIVERLINYTSVLGALYHILSVT